jgi:hypothetical protein
MASTEKVGKKPGSTHISLRTLTQAKLDRLTRAFPGAKQLLARPEPRRLTHLMTLEFDTREKRLIDGAARSCGVDASRFMRNGIFLLADGFPVKGSSRRQRRPA